MIGDIVNVNKLPIHLKPVDLSPAGDPLARVEKAIRLINDHRRKRVDFAARFILLDSDQAALEPERAATAKQLANKNEIVLVWQNPCHEALLLRHWPDQHTKRPATSEDSERFLKKMWPEYNKPMERRDIAAKIDIAALKRAATVEPELRQFLIRLGLLVA
jgi:hypothetical protein